MGEEDVWRGMCRHKTKAQRNVNTFIGRDYCLMMLRVVGKCWG